MQSLNPTLHLHKNLDSVQKLKAEVSKGQRYKLDSHQSHKDLSPKIVKHSNDTEQKYLSEHKRIETRKMQSPMNDTLDRTEKTRMNQKQSGFNIESKDSKNFTVGKISKEKAGTIDSEGGRKIHQIMTLGADTHSRSSKHNSPLMICEDDEPPKSRKKPQQKNEFINVCSMEFITKEEIEANEKTLNVRKKKAEDQKSLNSFGKGLVQSPNSQMKSSRIGTHDTEILKGGRKDIMYQGPGKLGIVIKSGQRFSPIESKDEGVPKDDEADVILPSDRQEFRGSQPSIAGTMQTMGRNSAMSNHSQNNQNSLGKTQMANLADQRRFSNNISPVEEKTLVSKQHLSRVAVRQQNKSYTVPEANNQSISLSKGAYNDYEYEKDIRMLGTMDNIMQGKGKLTNNKTTNMMTPQSGIDVSHVNLQPMIFDQAIQNKIQKKLSDQENFANAFLKDSNQSSEANLNRNINKSANQNTKIEVQNQNESLKEGEVIKNPGHYIQISDQVNNFMNIQQTETLETIQLTEPFDQLNSQMIDLHSNSIMKIAKDFDNRQKANTFINKKCKNINKSKIKQLVSKSVLSHQKSQQRAHLVRDQEKVAKINIWRKPIYHIQEPIIIQNLIPISQLPHQATNSNDFSKPHTQQNSQLQAIGVAESQVTGKQGVARTSSSNMGPQITGKERNIDRASSQTINVDIMDLLQNQPINDDRSNLIDTNDNKTRTGLPNELKHQTGSYIVCKDGDKNKKMETGRPRPSNNGTLGNFQSKRKSHQQSKTKDQNSILGSITVEKASGRNSSIAQKRSDTSQN